MELQPQLVLQPPPGLGGRELYSKEQWEAQKTVIKQLYNTRKSLSSSPGQAEDRRGR
jgi:hypothetical protein